MTRNAFLSSFPLPFNQEKVNQLKDEVRLQYEKMHQILDEDLRKTMEILDKAQAKFCNENAAQVLHLSERMQEAKKLLSSVQVMYDKTEDINFMKVKWRMFENGEGPVGVPGSRDKGNIGSYWRQSQPHKDNFRFTTFLSMAWLYLTPTDGSYLPFLLAFLF